MSKRKIALMVSLIMLCSGFSLEKSKWIWHKSEYSYVRLAKADKGVLALEHPAEISPEQIVALFTSIRYQRSWANLGNLVKPKEYDLFSREEAEQIAPYLSQAFKEANSSQWVDFSLEVHRGSFLVFGSDQVTDGIAFVKEGKLNLAFRNISEKLGPERTPNIVNPLKGFPGSARLIPGKGQELAKNKKGKVSLNWLIVDLKGLEEPKEQIKPAESKEQVKPAEVKPEPKASLEKTEEQAGAQKRPAQTGKSIKERLTELRELYEQGLISEEEYNKKREEILKEL